MNLGNEPNTSIIVTAITVIGGVITTYIISRAKRLNPRSKEHIDKRVEAYEKIIKRLDTESIRKDEIIARRDITIERQTNELNYLRALLSNRSLQNRVE